MLKSSLRFEKFYFYLILFLFAFIPLYPKFPLLNVKGTFVAVRLEDILIALAVIVWLLYIVSTKQFLVVLKNRLNIAILLFLGIGFLSLISAYFITHTISLNLGILHFLRRVEVIVLLPVVYGAINHKRQLTKLLIVWGVVTFIVCLYAFGQQYLHWPVISTTNSEFSKGQILYLTPDARVNSSFAGHYDLAVFLVMVLSILSAIFFAFKNRYQTVFIAVLGMMSFVVLVMTAARLSFVAVLVGVTTSLILVGKKIFLLGLLAIAILAVVYPSQLRDRLISTVQINILDKGPRYESPNKIPTLNLSTLPESSMSGSWVASESATLSGILNRPPDVAVGEPVDTTDLGVYRSFEIRLNVEWPRALNAFYKNIFLGSGYSSLGLATDSDFLRSLGEVGILGTLSLALVLLIIFKEIWRIFKQVKNNRFIKYFCAGVMSLMVAFVVNAIFIDVFEASKVASIFWMILGASLAVGKLYKEEE